MQGAIDRQLALRYLLTRHPHPPPAPAAQGAGEQPAAGGTPLPLPFLLIQASGDATVDVHVAPDMQVPSAVAVAVQQEMHCAAVRMRAHSPILLLFSSCCRYGWLQACRLQACRCYAGDTAAANRPSNESPLVMRCRVQFTRVHRTEASNRPVGYVTGAINACALIRRHAWMQRPMRTPHFQRPQDVRLDFHGAQPTVFEEVYVAKLMAAEEAAQQQRRFGGGGGPLGGRDAGSEAHPFQAVLAAAHAEAEAAQARGADYIAERLALLQPQPDAAGARRAAVTDLLRAASANQGGRVKQEEDADMAEATPPARRSRAGGRRRS